MTPDSKYSVNFFKQTTAHGRTNAKIITTMVIIWAVAVFGFQILLKVFEEPTPEKTYTTYESVSGKVLDGTASVEEKKSFIDSVIAVLGKSLSLEKEHKAVMQQVLNWALYDFVPEKSRDMLSKENSEELGKMLGYSPKSLQAGLLQFYIMPEKVSSLSDESRTMLPEIMKKYCIHFESGLTSAQFLGFPFHYWYTAEFLLILFVTLCLIYCKMIDKLHIKHAIEEEDEG